jgi:cation diffusion facilitator CzcD-associated flavoprotein CzcO
MKESLEVPRHPAAVERLAALEARVRQDQDYLCRPAANWVLARRKDGEAVVDVVIIGGGMVGQLAWFALNSAGIRNLRILDRAPAGLEGPWVTYARMETLRSPKQLTGPAYGYGSLTCRAWYTAVYGEAAWDALDKIPRITWMDYLKWYRKVLAVPVENEVAVTRIRPEGDYLRLELAGKGAREASLLARKVVMATGRDGTGHPAIPAFMAGLPRSVWAHSSDDIDFTRLKGNRVVVVGAGASAVENAAEALEHGAREARLLVRRRAMPTINKMMGIGSFGFTAGFAELPDEWRWRFMQYSFATQTPAPRGSTLRVSRHANAHFHFGYGVKSVRLFGKELVIETTQGVRLATDFIILGTGFTTDPLARSELEGYADKIALWRDRYTPPPGEENVDLGNFPYLNPDFSFCEREPGTAPWLGNIYCFNYGASASLGKVSGDIPGISEGAAWLTRSLAATLYREDVAAHFQGMVDYAKPELLGDEWRESPLEPAEVAPLQETGDD